jgi:cell wall-associated NlpC family hydrolase
MLLSLTLAYGCALDPANPNAETKSSMAATQALTLVGKPYRFGGNSPQGFDCSGLVQYSYSLAGVNLPHGTNHLRRLSRPITQNQLQRGDILFFNQEGKKSSHVALYLGDDRFIHSPSSGKNVYIASFADPYWRRHFTEGRRLNLE